MMVETGDADAFLTGLYTKYSNTIKVVKEVIGIRPEYKHFAAMHIINSARGITYIADTLVNEDPDTGKATLNIPVPDKQTVHQFLSLLGQMMKN